MISAGLRGTLKGESFGPVGASAAALTADAGPLSGARGALCGPGAA